MKRAYLIIVDVYSGLEKILPDDEPVEFVIMASLNHNPFLHCNTVTLAPDSYQPHNVEGNPSA